MTHVQRTRLGNGLTVLTEEMHNAPVVALQIWINVGSADEDDGIAGIAHLHEHMLFKGTARRGVGEIARTVESCGGDINAWTSFDQTVYHVVMAAEEAGTGLDILADAVRHAAFEPTELQREIEVVLEEIRRDRDNPSRRLSRALFDLVFQEHPYRRPILGYEETVKALSREQILTFFKTHYRPDNAVLVATGDFRTDALLSQIDTYFGDWRADGAYIKPPRAQEPRQNALRVRILQEPVKEARLACAWQVPGLHHSDVAAIDLMSVIMGYGDASRLFVETRRRRELVNDVYAYAYTPRDPGLFAAGAGLRGENMPQALASVLEQAYRFRDGLVTHEELQRARVVMLSDAAYQRETVQGQARKRAFFEVVAGDYAFEEGYYEALKSLTAEDIRAVAERYLTDTPSVVLQGDAAEGLAIRTEDVHGIVAQAVKGPGVRRVQRYKPGDYGITRVELANGAVVLVREEKDSPVVAMQAAALGGQRYESKETQGLGNLFASVWGLATENLGVEAMARRVDHLGGSIGAFSGRNAVGLRGEFIRETAQEGLELFCDVLLRPQLRAEDLERERAVMLERIRSREDSPAGVAFDAFAAALYPTHPYGLRLSGSEESVTRLTLQQLEAHRAQFLSGDKLVIAVVGDIDTHHVVDFLGEQLGRQHGAALEDAAPRDLPPEAPVRVRCPLEKEQSHIIIGTMGVRIDEPERYVLDVLSTILSGQSGRLFLDLRDRHSLAYSVSSSSLEGVDPGYFLVHMATAPDKVPQAVHGVYAHLARLREELVSADELQRAQRYLVGSHAIELQRCGARGSVMALAERFGLGYDHYTRYPASIRAVQAEQVREVANRVLNPQRLVEVVVGPGG